MDQIGIIYGSVGTTRFNVLLNKLVEKNEYIQVNHETYNWILCQIDEIERQTDLSLDRAIELSHGSNVSVTEKMIAKVSTIGYRDDRNILQTPKTPLKAGSVVYKATDDVIKKVLGLTGAEKSSAYIGLLYGHDLKIYLDINTLVQKHVSVLAKTGGGKSYLTGDLIEEFIKHKVTVLIFDPHGEYSTLKEPGKKYDGQRKFDVSPRGYASQILEYSPDTKVNPGTRPLKFTLSALDPRDILGLTSIKNVRQYLTYLRKAVDIIRQHKSNYSIDDIIDVLLSYEDPQLSPLITELEYMREIDIFADKGTHLSELLHPGKTTIINLRGVPPDIQELVVNRIMNALFQLRKLQKIPPLITVLEEAHNYCPQQGISQCSRILRTIASEGRKFGLGLFIVTQRAAKVDKNVLSQCNTQIILKITNPNDLNAVTASVEGLTPGMADAISSLPIGVAIVTGGGLSMPIFVEVRPRETKHGGESVKVVE